MLSLSYFFFFFNDTATTEIYTLSLHDALPISTARSSASGGAPSRSASTSPLKACISAPTGSRSAKSGGARRPISRKDRKSTRLNSSHSQISYAVFCLKKKTKYNDRQQHRLSSN